MTPSPVLINFNTILGSGQQRLRVIGTRADGTTSDLTATATGTTYTAGSAIIGVTPTGILFANASALTGRGRTTLTIQNSGVSTVIEVTVDAFSPQPLSALGLPGDALNLTIRGSLAFVADGAAGLTIVDLTSKSEPRVVSTTSVGSPVHQVAVLGSFAYVAAETQLVMLDVTDPSAPVQLAALPMTGATGIQVSGNHAYVADGPSGVRVVSLNPFPTSIVRTLATSSPATAIAIDRTRLLALAGPNTLYYDATLASAPSLVGSVQAQNPKVSTTFSAPTGALVTGFYGYIANGFNGIVALDLRAAPTIVGGSDLGPAVFNAVALAPTGSLLFASDARDNRNSAYIFGLTDAANPTFAGSINFTPIAPAGPLQNAIAADRQYAYVTRPHQFLVGQFLRFADTGTIAPTVSITSPAEGAVVAQGGALTVTVEAQDDVAVESVSVLLGDTVVATQKDFPLQPFLLTAPSTGISAVIGARAMDFNGNVGIATARTITLASDLVPPIASFQLFRPERTQFAVGELISFTGSATDDKAVARLELLAGGNLVDSVVLAPPRAVATVTLRGSSQQAGPIEFVLRAIDTSGNVGTSTLTLTITTNPTTTFPSGGSIAADDTYFERTSVTVTGGTLQVAGTHTFADLTLQNGAVLTSPTSSGSIIQRLEITVDNLTIDAASRIDASGRGYLGWEGPSPGAYGGSHGGLGYGARPTHGNELDPDAPGGGGDWARGGGVVRLAVQNRLTLNGGIRSDGVVGGFNGYYGGAGGSIRIDVGELVGAGVITANGANPNIFGGGGGRIAIYYGSRSFTGDAQALGGKSWAGGNPYSGAGTVFWRDTSNSAALGELVIDNRGRDSSALAAYTTPLRSFGTGTVETIEPSSLTAAGVTFPVPNRAAGQAGLVGLRVRPNRQRAETFRIVDNTSTTLMLAPEDGDASLVAAPGDTFEGVLAYDNIDIRGLATVSSGSAIHLATGPAALKITQGTLQVPALRAPGRTMVSASSLVLFGQLDMDSLTSVESSYLDLRSSALPVPTGNMTLRASTVVLSQPLVANRLDLLSGSVLAHQTFAGTITRLELTLQDLTIDAASRIDASGRGYLGWEGPSPGAYGGSHGGLGYGARPTHGNELDPDAPGGGADWARGGGVVRLAIQNRLTLNGGIRSDGVAGGFNGRYGSAGGSIRIDAGELAGTGVITANGANPNIWGGGGGRIAIYYGSRSFTGDVQSFGGRSWTGGNPYSGAGTVFWRDTSKPAARGELVVDNRGRDSSALAAYTTPLRSFGTGTVAAIEPSLLTAVGGTFPVPNRAAGQAGLVGLRVRPNRQRPETFRIVDNTSTTLLLAPEDGDASLVAAPGDTFEGVLAYDDIDIRGLATVSSTGPIQLTPGPAALKITQGTLQVPALRAPGRTMVSASSLVLIGQLDMDGLASVESSYLDLRDSALPVPTSNMALRASTVVLSQPLVASRLDLLTGSVLAHQTFAGTITRLELSVQDMTIDSASRIDVSGRGYLGWEGPSPSAQGGSHGGLGQGARPTYGNELDPDAPGGGADWARGGGVVRLAVQNRLTLNGGIRSDGVAGGFNGRYGSAGGSIRIDAGELAGTGVITANGAFANWYAGAGGRIAIYYGTKSFTGDVQSLGGRSGNWPFPYGGAGTAFWRDTSNPSARGELVVDARGRDSSAIAAYTTPLRSVGSGTIEGFFDAGLVATGTSPFPELDPASGKAGLVGLLLRVGTASEVLTILSNTVKQLTTDAQPAGLANMGDPYSGVRILDSLRVLGAARVQSADPIEAGSTTFSGGSVLSSPNLVYP